MTSRTYQIIFLLISAMIIGCGIKREPMKKLSPDEIHGWKTKGHDMIYDRKTIFDYINGAGELYLSYGFRQVLVRQFVKADEPRIEVAIFDMGSSEDAFGVFSFEQEEKDIGIGQGSEYTPGLLRFWKGKYFVCVMAEYETPLAKKAMLDLGRKIDKSIKTKGSKPKIIDFLPKNNLVDNSIRYFHKHSSLNYFYFVADENILNLSEETDVVLAQYQLGKDITYLLLIDYKDKRKAQKAYNNFLNIFLSDAKETGIAKIENGKYTGADLQDKFVLIVFDAPTKKEVKSLIEDVKRKLVLEG